MIASLALFVIATTDEVVVAVVIVYIGITTCSLSNTYHSSKLWVHFRTCTLLLLSNQLLRLQVYTDIGSLSS